MDSHQKNQSVNQGTTKKKPRSLSFAPVTSDFELENAVNNDDQRAPNYLALYGLRESAFSQDIDDGFFFTGHYQIKYLSLLHKLIENHNLILHIKGESGVGKTCLINRFINIGEKNWRFSFFSANAMMNIEQLYYNISAGFGLSAIAKNDSELKKKCFKNISLLENSGVVPILIIDDVQELPIESLKSIYEMLNASQGEHRGLRIILISNLQFGKILESKEPGDFQKIITKCLEIKPLIEKQIEKYIYFRLTKAGLDGGNPITPRACSIILEKSKGLPRDINRLCHIALRDGMEEMSMKEFFDDHNFNFPYRKYLITGAFVAIFLSLLFGYIEPYGGQNNQLFSLNNENDEAGQSSGTAISSSSILGHLSDENIKPLDDASTIKLDGSVDKKNDIVKFYDFSQIKMNLTNELVRANSTVIFNLIKSDYENRKKTTQNKIKSGKKVNSVVVSRISNKPPAISSLKPDKIFSSNLKTTVRVNGSRFTNQSKVSILTKSGINTISEKNKKHISNSQIEIEIMPNLYSGKNLIEVSNVKLGKSNKILLEIIPAKATKKTAVIENDMEGYQWILAQKSNAFILQILGSKQKAELVKFIYKKKVKGQYATFETNRNGTKWYHLILGPYENKNAAKLAVLNLPKQVNTPWIRPIKDIQRLIQRINSK